MEIIISVIGAIVSVIIAVIGAIFANRNAIILQTRKLKEEYYFSYIDSLNKMMLETYNPDMIDNVIAQRLSSDRNKLLVVASESVVTKMIEYEEKAFGKESKDHNKLLTELIKFIRDDLKIESGNYPEIGFKQYGKKL